MIDVRLAANSTVTDYLIQFLEKAFAAVGEVAHFKESVSVVERDAKTGEFIERIG